MKRLAVVASLIVFAACAPKAEETTLPADSTAVTAPAATDSMAMDSTKKDSAAAPMADTTKH